jgi:hypothetical protein
LAFDAAVFKPSNITGFRQYNNSIVFMMLLHPQGSLGKEADGIASISHGSQVMP